MTSVLDSLLGGAALSEGFTDAAHPRGFHGRWIRTGDHHELKVFHGSEHLGNVPADDRTRMMIGASNVVGRAGKTITTKDVGSLVDRALGEFGSEGPRRPENLGAQRRDAANVHLRQANPLGRTATRVAGGQRVASGAAARQAEVAQIKRKSPNAAAELAARTGQPSLAEIKRQQALRAGAPYAKGDKVHVVTPQGHVLHGVVAKGPQTYGVITSRGSERSTTVEVHWKDGDVSHERPADINPGHPNATRRIKESEPSALGVLLEGFAAVATDPLPSAAGRFAIGDQVRVAEPGKDSIVGRVQRGHHADVTHVVIAPEGGGPHVAAKVAQTSLDTPARHRAEARQREAEKAAELEANLKAAGAAPPGKPGKPAKPLEAGKPEPKPQDRVREGITVLVEAFAPAPANPTVAQTNASGAAQVKQAQHELATGSWNSSKHPRGRGGKFGYTTGGKRAKRSPAASQRTLGVGASGALVRSVQKQLGLPVDGQYGQATRAAVTRYQQQHGLQVDGVVGRQTLAALRGHSNAKSITPGPIASKTATVRVAKPSKRAKPAKHKLTAKQKAARAPVRAHGGIVI